MGKTSKSNQQEPSDLSEALATTKKRDRAAAKARKDARGPRTEEPAKPGMPGSVNDSRRCSATAHRTGERCKAPAIKGGTVCRVHGGAAGHVQKSAKERLLELADPAIAALSKIVRDEEADDSVRLRAALGIMDRVGLGPGQTITVERTKFDDMLDTAFVDLDRSLPGGGPTALVAGGGDHTWEDYAQHSADARAEAWREYDHEDSEDFEQGRIRPDENTVQGTVVVSRYYSPPDLGATDPPRAWGAEVPRGDG